MSSFIIRRATIKDVKEIAGLTAHFARKQVMLNRKEEDIVQNLRDYFVVVKPKGKSIIVCVALHIYTNRYSEIKALAVYEEYQKFGLGRRLVKRCIKEAKDLGVPKVFALTYVENFFKRLRFIPSNRNHLPQKIWEECSVCSKQNNCTEICLEFAVN
jgi:amino-acid N-acetyltransferase